MDAVGLTFENPVTVTSFSAQSGHSEITDLQTRPRRRRKEARAAACTLDETIQF
jgi:hypothetical protein